jgi:hypothetical protein
MTSILETAKQVVADPGEIAATKDQLIAAIQAGANQADIRNFERAIWQLFDRAHATKVLLEANNSLRTTLSRQAELLGRAAKALKPFADGLQFYRDDSIDNETFLDWSENIKVGDLRTASTTYDAIREELKEPNDD